MKADYAFVQYDDVIGYVYDSEKFGKVFVVDRFSIDLNKKIEIYNLNTYKSEEDVDLLELLFDHLGIKENEDFNFSK